MKAFETSVGRAGPRVLPARPAGERVTWLAIVCLVGALFLVRSGYAPDQALRLANPLALALFVMVYVLIRIREAGGRL